MITKKVRYISLFAAICLALVPLCACSGQKETASSQTTTTGDTQSVVSEAPQLVFSSAFTINDYAVIALLDNQAKVKAGSNVQNVLDAISVEEGFRVTFEMADGTAIADNNTMLIDGMKMVVLDSQGARTEEYVVALLSEEEIKDKVIEAVEDERKNNPQNSSIPQISFVPPPSTNSSTGQTPSGSGSTPSNNTSTGSTASTVNPNAVLKGKTIQQATIASRDTYEGQTDDSKAYQKKLKQLETQYGCKTQFIYYDPNVVVNSVVNDVMAGKKVADFLHVSIANARSLAARGIIVDVAEKLPELDLKKTYHSGTTDSMTFGKKVYGVAFPGMGTNPMGVFYNKNIIKKFCPGVDIDQLYLTKKWTFDKFEEIAKACTKDTNGDSKPDIYGIVSTTHIIGMALSANAGGTAIMVNGKVKDVMCGQAGIDAYSFCKRLYSANTWNFNPDWMLIQEKFTVGDAAFFPFYMWANNLIAPSCEFEFGFVPFPMGPAQKDYVSGTYDGSCFSMTRTAANSSATCELVQAYLNLYPQELNDSLQNNYIKQLRRNGLNETAISVYKWAINNATAEYSTGVSYPNSVNELNNAVFDKSKDPSSTAASIRLQVEAAVEDYYKPFY